MSELEFYKNCNIAVFGRENMFRNLTLCNLGGVNNFVTCLQAKQRKKPSKKR